MQSLRLLRSLYVQVIIAIVIGVLLGYFHPEFAVSLKPFGDAFVKLIKTIIAPVIFCTVVLGIAGMENLKSVGRTGALALRARRVTGFLLGHTFYWHDFACYGAGTALALAADAGLLRRRR